MNNVLNNKMYAIFLNKIVLKHKINSALRAIVESGFILHNGCYFLKSLYNKQTHIKESDFIDLTGFECFINSIHIDDYAEIDLFEQAILFADELINLWKNQKSGLVLKLILSETDFGFNVKFHTFRKGQDWIVEDELEKFEEAIIVMSIYS
ncbi:MAG: hypothetical protein ACK5C0_14840 [Candidatus Kapaibacterium sp.]